MTPTDVSSESTSSSPGTVQRFSAVRMPIEEPVENVEAAVEKLCQCSSTELRRARKHHRRALDALQNGGYNALSDATREHLVNRLRNNLEALDRALDTTRTKNSSADQQDDSAPSSFSSRFRAFFQELW